MLLVPTVVGTLHVNVNPTWNDTTAPGVSSPREHTTCVPVTEQLLGAVVVMLIRGWDVGVRPRVSVTTVPGAELGPVSVTTMV